MLLGQLTLDVGKFRHLLRVESPAAGGRRARPPAPAAARRAAREKRTPPMILLANFQFILNI